MYKRRKWKMENGKRCESKTEVAKITETCVYSLCHGECRYGELVFSWIRYTIYRRITYNVQIYITIRWSQCCITVRSPAHRRASLLGPFFLRPRSFYSPDLTEGSRPIFFIRGSCNPRIPYSQRLVEEYPIVRPIS